MIYHIISNVTRDFYRPNVGSSRRWALRSRRLTGEAWDVLENTINAMAPLVKCYKKTPKNHGTYGKNPPFIYGKHLKIDKQNYGTYWKTHH